MKSGVWEGVRIGVAAVAACLSAHAALALETEALQRRIDDLAASGGGTLVITRGTHRTGALFFRPGVNLHLEEGAVLLGSDDAADYPQRLTRIEGQTHVYFPALVNADACDGFRVTGAGVIDGHGLPTWRKFWKMREESLQKGDEFDNQHPALVRPRLFYVSNSKHVDVSGVTFRNAKYWTTHYYRCEDLFVHDCTIVSEQIDGVCGPATDAIDLDVVRHVVISNVVMDVNDDAIALKGGKGPWADDPAKHPENGPNADIEIVGCRFKSTCHSCLCFGSECVKGSDVTLRDCRVENPHYLLRLKVRPDTPQLYENIVVSNVCGDVRTLLLVRPWLQYFDLQGRPDRPKSGIRHVTLANLDLTCDCFTEVVRSDDCALSDFAFARLNLRCRKSTAFDRTLVEGVRWSDVRLTEVPEVMVKSSHE